MAMTRTDAANYAASEFAELLADAGLTATENGGLSTPIDRALRSLGIETTGPVPDEKVNGFFAVLDWAILARIERAMANRVDVTVDGPNQSKRYSQAVAHVRALKDEAWLKAEPYLTIEAETDEWDIGSISLGIVSYPLEGVW